MQEIDWLYMLGQMNEVTHLNQQKTVYIHQVNTMRDSKNHRNIVSPASMRKILVIFLLKCAKILT